MHETYHQFNEALQRGLTDKTLSVPAMATPADAPDGQGTLVVQVTLAKGALPVEGALVQISSTEEPPVLLAQLRTDGSGRTAPITLAAPSGSLSQTPDPLRRPYSTYNITVDYPGYYATDAVNVPIFDRINSIQPISLLPLGGDVSFPNPIVVDETSSSPSLE